VDASQEAGDLSEVSIRWKEPDGTESTERTFSIRADQSRARVEDASPAFRFGAAVAELAEIMRHSTHSEGARFDEVITLARSAGYEGADAEELLRLARRAKDLSAQ
jgi:hypothetical protein